jgi:hypothetical protein
MLLLRLVLQWVLLLQRLRCCHRRLLLKAWVILIQTLILSLILILIQIQSLILIQTLILIPVQMHFLMTNRFQVRHLALQGRRCQILPWGLWGRCLLELQGCQKNLPELQGCQKNQSEIQIHFRFHFLS